MTLNTDIYVQDPVNPVELFFKVRELVGCDPSHRFESREWYGRQILRNLRGQGLDAWAAVYYQFDSSLLDEDADDDTPACWAIASFDTGYSYREPGVGGCGDLHVLYIARLGEWLDAGGVRWSWRNEFTDEVWGPGPDRYEHLSDLASEKEGTFT